MMLSVDEEVRNRMAEVLLKLDPLLISATAAAACGVKSRDLLARTFATRLDTMDPMLIDD